MRLTTAIAAGVLTAGPMFAFSPAAHAEQNDLLGRAQQYLNNNNQGDQNAYERGRQDEMRREQADRSRRYQPDDQRLGDRDFDRDSRDRHQDRDTYNYSRYP